MKVDDLDYYVNVCFSDLETESVYYQSSDPEILRSLDLPLTIKEGDKITIGGKNVIVKDVQASLLDETDDYSIGLRWGIAGKEIPFIAQIIIWTKEVS